MSIAETIKNSATAGTLESSDIFIQVFPPSDKDGIEIELESAVIYQFGDQIRQVIRESLELAGIKHAVVRAVDRGALDCTIKARMRTAISRAIAAESIE